jgi:hypothetical protein
MNTSYTTRWDSSALAAFLSRPKFCSQGLLSDAPQLVSNFVNRQRLAEVVALNLVTLMGPQE